MDNYLKVKNIVIDVALGKEYKITLRNPSGKGKTSELKRYQPFIGRLIQITDDHLTFRSINYRESFLKIDFAIKTYLISEINGKLVDVSY
ncbi:MAG: hypothetical protein WCZ27_09045 [Tissierellaceae bacterium]